MNRTVEFLTDKVFELIFQHRNLQACESMRHKASVLEDSPDDKFEEELDEEERIRAQKAADGGGAGSVSSDSMENARTQAMRYMATWKDHIMGEQGVQLTKLKYRVQLTVVVLTVIALIAFVLLDLQLFNGIASHTMERISSTGKFRTEMMQVAYYLREQMLVSKHEGDPDTVFEMFTDRVHQFHILTTLDELKSEHTKNYEGSIEGVNKSPDIAKLYTDLHIKVFEPYGAGFVEHTTNFWELLNSFVRKLVQASTCSVEELRDPDINVETISERKKEILFVYRNIFSSMLPEVEPICDGYVQEIHKFASLATVLIILFTFLNGICVIITSIVILRSLVSIRRTMQSKLTCCCLAFHLPAATCKTFHKYYSKIGFDLDNIEGGFDSKVDEKKINEDDEEEETGDDKPFSKSSPFIYGEDTLSAHIPNLQEKHDEDTISRVTSGILSVAAIEDHIKTHGAIKGSMINAHLQSQVEKTPVMEVLQAVRPNGKYPTFTILYGLLHPVWSHLVHPVWSRDSCRR